MANDTKGMHLAKSGLYASVSGSGAVNGEQMIKDAIAAFYSANRSWKAQRIKSSPDPDIVEMMIPIMVRHAKKSVWDYYRVIEFFEYLENGLLTESDPDDFLSCEVDREYIYNDERIDFLRDIPFEPLPVHHHREIELEKTINSIRSRYKLSVRAFYEVELAVMNAYRLGELDGKNHDNTIQRAESSVLAMRLAQELTSAERTILRNFARLEVGWYSRDGRSFLPDTFEEVAKPVSGKALSRLEQIGVAKITGILFNLTTAGLTLARGL